LIVLPFDVMAMNFVIRSDDDDDGNGGGRAEAVG